MTEQSILKVMQSRKYRAWLLTILILANMFAFMDRQIISVLSQPIKIDLSLTDTQLGLLGGIAFAALNCVVSVPIARAAERMKRVTIYGIGILLWSAATIVSGFATGFLMLLLARVAVGIGEASQPAATSLMADYYPPQQRVATASIVVLAIPLGALIGGAAGGFIAEQLGWRWAFIIIGAPGILLGVLFLLTVKEPLRGHYDPVPETGDAIPPISAVFRRMLDRPSYIHVLLGSTLASAGGFGINIFMAAYFVRRFDMSFTESGLISGLISAVPGIASMFVGGMLVNHFGKRNPQLIAILPAFALLITAPLYVLSFLQSDWTVAVALLMTTGLFQYIYLPASMGVYANTMQPRMRATSEAVVVVFVSLIGSGAGPLIVGMLSDLFATNDYAGNFAADCSSQVAAGACHDASSYGLTTAMTVLPFVYLWSAFHFFRAARTIRRDMS